MKIAPQAIQTKKISKKRTAYMTENPDTKSISLPSFLETVCCGLWRVKAGNFSGPPLPMGHLSLWGVADLDSRPHSMGCPPVLFLAEPLSAPRGIKEAFPRLPVCRVGLGWAPVWVPGHLMKTHQRGGAAWPMPEVSRPKERTGETWEQGLFPSLPPRPWGSGWGYQALRTLCALCLRCGPCDPPLEALQGACCCRSVSSFF